MATADYWKRALADVQSGKRTDFTPLTNNIPSFEDWLNPARTNYYNALAADRGTRISSGEENYGQEEAYSKSGFGGVNRFRDMASGAGLQYGGLDQNAENDYLKQFYSIPSYEGTGSFLEKLAHNAPLIAAGAFGTAGALGGLDQFAAGGAGGVGGGVGGGIAAEAAPLAGSTGTGVSAAFDPALGGGYWSPAVDTGAAVAGGNAASGTALSRLLGLTPAQGDLLSVGGTLGATGLGMYSANKKADALRDIAGQSRADRAPFLNKATQYLNDPSAYINGPGQEALKGTLHALSARVGNPIGSSSALQIATGSALQDWRNATTGFANIGLSGEDSRNQLLAGGAQSDADVFTTLAGGAADILAPRRRSLADLAKEMRSVGLI